MLRKDDVRLEISLRSLGSPSRHNLSLKTNLLARRVFLAVGTNRIADRFSLAPLTMKPHVGMQRTRCPDTPAGTQPFSGGARGGALLAEEACPFSSCKKKPPCTLHSRGADMTSEKKGINTDITIDFGPTPEHGLLRQETDTVANRFQASPRRETLIIHFSFMHSQDPFLQAVEPAACEFGPRRQNELDKSTRYWCFLFLGRCNEHVYLKRIQVISHSFTKGQR